MSFFHSLVKRIIDVLLMSTLHVRGSEGLNSLNSSFAHTVAEMSDNAASLSRPALFQRGPKHFLPSVMGFFCRQTWIFVGRMYACMYVCSPAEPYGGGLGQPCALA